VCADPLGESYLKNVIGNTVWLIAGEGRPRRFSICLAFTAEDIGESTVRAFDLRE